MAVRAGFLVPYTNTVFEEDLRRMPLRHVSYHVTRIGGYSEAGVPDGAEMTSMGADDLSGPLDLIRGIAPEAVVYASAASSIMHGPDHTRALERQMVERSGAGVGVTAMGAICQSLRVLGARRIGFASPYVTAINDAACAYFEREGFEIGARADLGAELKPREQGRVGPGAIIDLVERTEHSARGKFDALILPCTNLDAVSLIPEIEAAIGKPVVTSNQAIIFALAAALGASFEASLPGALSKVA